MPTATPAPKAPAAPRQLTAQPTAPVVPFETPSTEPTIKKMAPEDNAMHVTTLDDAEFRDALDLGSIVERRTEPAQEAEPLLDVVDTAREAAEGAVAGQEAPTEEAAEAPTEIPTLSRSPETPFTVADAEGELEIPDLFVNFKANGKEYERVPFDKVVGVAPIGG